MPDGDPFRAGLGWALLAAGFRSPPAVSHRGLPFQPVSLGKGGVKPAKRVDVRRGGGAIPGRALRRLRCAFYFLLRSGGAHSKHCLRRVAQTPAGRAILLRHPPPSAAPTRAVLLLPSGRRDADGHALQSRRPNRGADGFARFFSVDGARRLLPRPAVRGELAGGVAGHPLRLLDSLSSLGWKRGEERPSAGVFRAGLAVLDRPLAADALHPLVVLR